MKKLGACLKQLRKEADLSLREVAQKCGLTPSYLSKIEKGDSFSTLSIHTLLKFSKFYDIPIGALLKKVGLVESDEYELPEFPQYLRAKYHLSPQAIRDTEIAKKSLKKNIKNKFFDFLYPFLTRSNNLSLFFRFLKIFAGTKNLENSETKEDPTLLW